MLTDAQRNRLAVPPHVALMAIESGCGLQTHRDDLGEYINLATVCASRMVGVATETREALCAAVYAIRDMDKRFERTGRWGFSGPEMLVVHKAVTLGDALMVRANSAVVTAAAAWLLANNTDD
jgi:hypothetical protein